MRIPGGFKYCRGHGQTQSGVFAVAGAIHGEVVKEELEAKGVGVYAGHAVEQIEKTGGGLQVVCADLTLAADMVLVGIGVTPSSQIADRAGLELSVAKSIAVDRRLRTSDENIYAAGDCADAYHVVTGAKTWIPLALRANRAGWAVADNVIGKNATLDGVAGTSVFRVFDFEVARTGLNLAEAQKAGFDAVENMIQSSSRAHSYSSAAHSHLGQHDWRQKIGPAAGRSNGRQRRRGPPHQCPGSGPAQPDDRRPVQPDGSGLRPAVRADLGSDADGSQSVIEETINR